MGEAVANLVLLVWAFSAIESNAHAQVAETYTIEDEAPAGSPVVVFGSANEGHGKRDSVLIKQNNDENPLGNPIISDPQTLSSDDPLPAATVSLVQNEGLQHVVNEVLPQNPKLSPQESPQIVDKQIQNTLYESGGRIYDIQSYPVTDVNYIEQPNINRSITTYPAN